MLEGLRRLKLVERNSDARENSTFTASVGLPPFCLQRWPLSQLHCGVALGSIKATFLRMNERCNFNLAALGSDLFSVCVEVKELGYWSFGVVVLLWLPCSDTIKHNDCLTSRSKTAAARKSKPHPIQAPIVKPFSCNSLRTPAQSPGRARTPFRSRFSVAPSAGPLTRFRQKQKFLPKSKVVSRVCSRQFPERRWRGLFRATAAVQTTAFSNPMSSGQRIARDNIPPDTTRASKPFCKSIRVT